MNRGKWYFVCTYLDTFGGGLAGRIEHEEIPLKATTEDEALTEANGIWTKKVAEAHSNWERQKKVWKSPPASPFTNGPRTPRVIYRISLD